MARTAVTSGARSKSSFAPGNALATVSARHSMIGRGVDRQPCGEQALRHSRRGVRRRSGKPFASALPGSPGGWKIGSTLRPGASKVSSRVTEMMAKRRWPSSTRCRATARAPPRSSMRTELVCRSPVTSRRTKGSIRPRASRTAASAIQWIMKPSTTAFLMPQCLSLPTPETMVRLAPRASQTSATPASSERK